MTDSDLIVAGSGPAIVFLHGAGVDNQLWSPQIEAFRDTHTVVVPNLPGHGGVPAADSVPAMADRILNQLDALSVSRYALVGLSLGGMVALDMTAQRPAVVTSLTMIESVARVTDSRLAQFLAKRVLDILGLVGPRVLSAIPASQMGAETVDAGRYVKTAMQNMTRQNTRSVLRAALAYDGREHLKSIIAPVLVMVGEKNAATHERARLIADQVENGEFVVIPGAGHIANRDAPQFVNEKLRNFLDEAF